MVRSIVIPFDDSLLRGIRENAKYATANEYKIEKFEKGRAYLIYIVDSFNGFIWDGWYYPVAGNKQMKEIFRFIE